VFLNSVEDGFDSMMSADPEEIWPRFYFTAGYGNFIKELRLHNWRNVISRSLLRHQLMPGSPSAVLVFVIYSHVLI